MFILKLAVLIVAVTVLVMVFMKYSKEVIEDLDRVLPKNEEE